MRILAFTVGDINLASARLRSFYLFHHLEQNNVSVDRKISITKILSYDLLHVQKLANLSPKLILVMLLFRLSGRPVVFDFDDNPQKLIFKIGFIFNLLIASHITTDTRARKEYWQSFLSFKRIEVIPDVLDRSPDIKDFRFQPIKLSSPKNILWLGHRDNLSSIDYLLFTNHVQTRFFFTVITSNVNDAELQAKYRDVKFIEWERDILFKGNKIADFMVLNHKKNFDTSMKSENKMVLSIAAGILPISSSTPAYVDLAKKLGCERLLFEDVSEVPSIVENVDVTWANNFIKQSQEYITYEYCSKRVSNLFIEYLYPKNPS